MLDPEFIRKNVEKVKHDTAAKNKDINLVDQWLEADKVRNENLVKVETLRAEKNKLSQNMQGRPSEDDINRAKEIKAQLETAESELAKAESNWIELIQQIPNVISEKMPVGKDENENQVMKKWGEIPTFDFKVKDHVEIGKELDLIDIDKSGEISGSRFYFLKNEAVLIQFAVIQLVFNTLTNEETLKKIANDANLDVSTKPFIPMLPPVIMKKEVMNKMDRLKPEDERYVFDKDELVFVGSAEHTVGPYHMNEVLQNNELPKRYIGYSTAFRREAGSYGKDTKGILRVHQFDKLEMETFTRAEDGEKEQEFIVAIQEYLMKQLNLPYQVISICSGDTGKPDYRQFDIETWIPSQNKYRETHTSDYMTDYQARRLNTKYDENGVKKLVHMNDATAFAMSRIIIAILENNQQSDGSVRIPEVLQKYVGKDVIAKR